MNKSMRDACARVARDAQASWVACSAPIQAATAERIAAAIEDLPDDAAADRIADLERAAETTRAEHAAALAEAKRREDKAVELTVVTHAANVKLHADRETLRAELAEHAAALGLATARIRELEGEREELLGRWIGPECGLGAMPLTAKEWKGCAEVIGQVEPASPLQPHADAPRAGTGGPQASG